MIKHIIRLAPKTGIRSYYAGQLDRAENVETGNVTLATRFETQEAALTIAEALYTKMPWIKQCYIDRVEVRI